MRAEVAPGMADRTMGAIYLVRHGQASFSGADYDDLSPLGHEQARVLGEALGARGIRPDLVLSGRLRRHRQTATACLGAMGLEPTWEEDAGWDEYDHNEVLGGVDPRFRNQAAVAAELAQHENPSRAFQAIFDRAMARWVDAAYHAEYAESWPAFCARIEDALARLHTGLGRSKSAIVFSSGGAISVVCRQLLGLADLRTMSLSGSIANASVTKLVVGGRGLTLSTLNEHVHFERPETKRLITYR